MKVIVAGGRNIAAQAIVERVIMDSRFKITELVCGMCPTGVDKHAVMWAKRVGKPIKEFPADWDKHGKAAGPIRNEEMAKYAEALILIWDGQSKGSASMLECAKRCGITIYERIVPSA